MSDGPFHILYGGNHGYLHAIYLSMSSVARRSKRDLCFHVLTMSHGERRGIDEEDRSLLEKMAKGFNERNEVFLYDVGQLFEERLQNNKNSDNKLFSPFCMLRLFADKVLPKDIGHVLYLDGDTLAYKPVETIEEVDISNAEFAAALDYLGRFWKGPWRRYFNSGVLWINLEKCRETNLFEKCIAYLETHHSMMPDQDALNKVNVAHIELDMKYNDQRKVKPTTVISHYPRHVYKYWNPVKPWEVDRMHKELKRHEFDEDLSFFLETFPFEELGYDRSRFSKEESPKK